MPSLQKQLELSRFERAIHIAESLAEHRALLTTAELVRMNQVLTGTDGKSDKDPWRQDAVTLTLPSGKVETLALIANPVLTARDLLHRATELAENGNALEAALAVYVGLVMSHVFEDANRRTAALAAHYFFVRYGVPLSGLAIHELGLGDLREPGQIEMLRQTVEQMVKFTASKKPPSKT
jgi:hypothetical protein